MERLYGIEVVHDKYGKGIIKFIDKKSHLFVCHEAMGRKEYRFPQVFIDKHLSVANKDRERFEEILILLENDGLIKGCKGITNYARLLFVLREYGFEGMIHTTNFDNFVSIIKSGYLMSRETLENSDASFEDVALQDVLGKTKEEVKENVRFYYGFGTPTNYAAKYERPVILVFDEKIMNEPGVKFCDGNAASDYTLMTKDFERAMKFDWHSIFERGGYGSSNIYDHNAKKRIRNAEFLYPDKISITRIKKIYFYDDKIMTEAKSILGDAISGFDCVVDNSKFFECGGTR